MTFGTEMLSSISATNFRAQDQNRRTENLNISAAV